MDDLREYVISVVSAALTCGILSRLIQKDTAKELARLLSGLFLVLTVISPLKQIDIDLLMQFPLSYKQEAEEAANLGKEMASEAYSDVIKTHSEAYILDKAAALNAKLSVEITVSDAYAPVQAELCGEISPYARTALEIYLESDLGITKENQIWIG